MIKKKRYEKNFKQSQISTYEFWVSIVNKSFVYMCIYKKFQKFRNMQKNENASRESDRFIAKKFTNIANGVFNRNVSLYLA